MKRGIALPEVTIAIIILAAALTPMLPMITRGSVVVGQSRLALLALHAARSEMDEARQRPFDRLKSHGWRALTKSVLRDSIDDRQADRSIAKDPVLAYPVEYARIHTRLDVVDLPEGPGPRRRKQLSLDVKWEEQGELHTRTPAALERLVTIVASDHADQ